MKATVIGTTFWLILMPALASPWSKRISEYHDALDRALNYASTNDRFEPSDKRRIPGELEVTKILHKAPLLEFINAVRTAQPGKPVQIIYWFHAIINPKIKKLRKRLVCEARIIEYFVNKKFYYILPPPTPRKNLRCREQVLAHKGNASLIAIDKDTEHVNKSHDAETENSTTIQTTTKTSRTTTIVTTPRTTEKLLSAGKNSDFSKQKTQLESLSRGMSNRRNSAPKMKNITTENMGNGLVQNLNFNKFQEQPKMKHSPSSSLTQSQHEGENGKPEPDDKVINFPDGVGTFQNDKVSHKVAEYKLKEATINVYMDRDTAKPWLPGPNKDVLKNAVVNIRIDSSDKNK